MTTPTPLPLDEAALDRLAVRFNGCYHLTAAECLALIAQARAALTLAARVAELEQERTDAAMRLSRAMNSPCLEVSSGGTFTGALMDFAAKRMAELEAERNGVVGALLAERAHANALRDACTDRPAPGILKCRLCGGSNINHADGKTGERFTDIRHNGDCALASTHTADLAAHDAEVGLRVLTAVGYVEPSTGADFDECKRRGREDVPMLNQVGRERAVARALAAQAATHSVPGGTSEVKP